jgi:hypothetical protein
MNDLLELTVGEIAAPLGVEAWPGKREGNEGEERGKEGKRERGKEGRGRERRRFTMPMLSSNCNPFLPGVCARSNAVCHTLSI